jgi:hypothetical protein
MGIKASRDSHESKPQQINADGGNHDASAGPDGIAIAPPAYGVGCLDSGLLQAAARLGPEARMALTTGTIQMKADPAGSSMVRQALNTSAAPEQTGADVIQLYSEQESTNTSDVEAAWAAREAMGIAIKSRMNHNVAVDYNDATNYARSAKNGHGEMFVFGVFSAKRGKKATLNIVSERQPCGPCEDDLKNFEAVAKPKLTISVDYFIKYVEGAGGDELWDYYQENLPDSDSEMSESE